MPLYDFLNENTGEIKSIFFNMDDNKEYIDESGYKWKRQFSVPQANISSVSKLNPFDSKSFAELTKNKKGTYGNLLDASKELSEKREKIVGKDEIKEQKFKEYSKLRNGKEHPMQKKEKLEKLKKEGISLKLK